MIPLLIRAAERAAADPYYLASRLGPDLHATAARLGITVESCYHLYLCPVPATGCELRRVCERRGVSEGVLRAVLGW